MRVYVCVCDCQIQMPPLLIAEWVRHPSPSLCDCSPLTPLIDICGVLSLKHRPGHQVYAESRAGDVLINLTDTQGVITLHLLSFSLSLFHSAPV